MSSHRVLSALAAFFLMQCLPPAVHGIEPIPQKSGFSGHLSPGVGSVRVETHTIAGTPFSDLGEERIDSLVSEPESVTQGGTFFTGELRYTFGRARTQIFAANSIEDVLRFDIVTEAGMRGELADGSLVQAGLLFSAFPTRVWEDPYVAGAARRDTDRRGTGVRLAYDRILGVPLEVVLSARNIDIGDERSGTALGLMQPLRDRLDRNGRDMNVTARYTIPLAGAYSLQPALSWGVEDLDGAARSNTRYLGALGFSGRLSGVGYGVSVFAGNSTYDARDPVFGERNHVRSYGAGASLTWHQLFGSRNWSAVLGAGFYRDDSEIDFYDQTVTTGSAGAVLRF